LDGLNFGSYRPENLKGRDHPEELGVDGKVWTRYIWLRIRAIGRLL
jgi:hypothetical protein